jgi:phage shock protein C
MQSIIQHIKYYFEEQSFGVCTRLGEKMKISASSIRLYFIYASFLTLGSPVIVYLSLAFIMEIRKHFRRHSHPTVWEL